MSMPKSLQATRRTDTEYLVSDRPPRKSNETARAEIEAQTAEFLARGGRVEVVPTGAGQGT